MTPRSVAVAGALALSVLTGAGVYAVTTWQQDSGVPTDVRSGAPSAGPQDEQQWARQPISAEEQEAGVLLKLRRTGPEASFLMRGIVGDLDPDLDLRGLVETTGEALARDVEGLRNLRRDVVVRRSHELAYFQYEQVGEGELSTTTDLFVLPTPRQTFYFSFRSATADHAALGPDRQTILDDVLATVEKKLAG